MDRRKSKYSQVLPAIIYYLGVGLQRPTIKGLNNYWTNMTSGWITKKTAVDCNKGLIYIVNMTKPRTNRFWEMKRH